MQFLLFTQYQRLLNVTQLLSGIICYAGPASSLSFYSQWSNTVKVKSLVLIKKS